jgi:NADH-ubiquinone oxidoreductase chain 4L
MLIIFFYFFLIPILLFFCGLLVFFFNYKHLLINLLRLEYIVLRIFLFIYLYLIFIEYEIFFTIVFLSFRVCEGVIGLSLLISIVRNYGNNYLQSLNFFLC